MDQHSNDILFAIESGIKKGRNARRMNKILKVNGYLLSVLLISFCALVNFSSSFADSLIGIPVIGDIVELVRFGSGYEEVAERGYFTEGDVFYEHDGKKLEVEAYYFSERKLNIILKGTGFNEDIDIRIESYDMTDENGEKINQYFASTGALRHNGKNHTGTLVIEREIELPETLYLELEWHTYDTSMRISHNDENRDEKREERNFDTIKSNITFYRNVFETSKVYSVNEKIEGENINFIVGDLMITPTTMNLEVDVETEGMKFYGFEEIYFLADGKKYPAISSGVVSSGDVDSGYVFYFESFYFEDPSDIKLVVDSYRAIDEKYTQVNIDLTGEIKPEFYGDYIHEFEIIEKNHYYELVFSIDENNRLSISDYNGVDIRAFGTTFDEDEYAKKYFEILKENIEGTDITITFSDYPEVIQLNKEIKVKAHQ